MRTLTKSSFGSPGGGRAGMSAVALVTLASALALTLVALALSATPAQSAERNANTTQVSGGKTLLKLDPDTAGALSDAGVKVEATGKATGPTGNGVFRFPIVGGKVDKDPLGGQIVHSGGLAFSAGSERVVVQRFVIDLDRGVLTAEVAGTNQRIALLDLGAPKGGVKVSSERLVLKDINAKLTAQAAGALNEAFDTELFEEGLLIGEATVIVQL
ncbi:MAG TPA: HtaA domain-containing protein [Gammaproteobacteria bacterium]|nr:HtaA domain-containing protein [Gammaproteobacteria bacterium]